MYVAVLDAMLLCQALPDSDTIAEMYEASIEVALGYTCTRFST